MRHGVMFAVALTLCLMSGTLIKSAVNVETERYDPLLHSDLIIRGRVLYNEWKRMTRGDWWPIEDPELAKGPLILGFGFVEVEEVLKGSWSGSHIIIVQWPLSAVLEGEEQIICLQFNPHLKGGTYVTKGSNGVFVESEGLWTRRSDGKVFTKAEIVERIDSGRIRHVIRESELIATGKILSRTVKRNDPRCDVPNNILHCELRADSVLKGEVAGDVIEFQIVVFGCDSLEWQSYAPSRIYPGERWYVFLKKGDMGFYLVAGSNGLFKIQGDKLIYDARIEFEYTKKFVDTLVKDEKDREN